MIHGRDLYAVAVTPNGTRVATAGSGGNIYFWNSETGQRVDDADAWAHEDRVQALAFSADGTLLASADEEGVLKLWDVEAKRLITTLSSHEADVTLAEL